MNKKLLSVLLAAVMILSLVPMTVFAEECTKYVSASGNDATGTGAADAPFATIQKAIDSIPDSGTVILLSDLNVSTAASNNYAFEILDGKDITLDGGGYKVKMNNAVRPFCVSVGKLTLTDVDIDMNGHQYEQLDDGKYTIQVLQDGELVLNDGAIIENAKYGDGFTNFSIRGTATMNDGAIIRNMEGLFGAIRVEGYDDTSGFGNFYMNGGLITGCTSESYGYEGVVFYISVGGKMVMTGGTITGNQDNAYSPGTIFLHANNMGARGYNEFTATGGTITGNSAIYGGVVYTDNNVNKINISGNVNFTGNTGTEFGGESNLYLGSDLLVNLEGGMGENSMVGVYTTSVPSNTADVKFAFNAAKADAGHFISDKMSTSGIIYDDGEKCWNAAGNEIIGYHHVNEENTLWLSTAAAGYAVDISSEIEHGTVTPNLKCFCPGDTVILTVTADEGYQLKSLAATYFDGEQKQNCEIVTFKGISFQMPAYDVTVTAEFEAAPPTYAITNGTAEGDKETNHGYISIDKESAAKDETVTVTVKPADGYQLKSLTVTPEEPAIAGALKGEFSVSATKKVHFSQGNLVATIDATGAPTAWKFAANQYESIGANVANTKIGKEAGDIDLFGWSTDAASNNWGIHTKTSETKNFTTGNFKDWGKAVGDGNTWRTLSKAEWTYLFNNHSKKWATVNGVKGYVIAPDGFAGTLSDTYADDAALAANNLVFLPAAGDRAAFSVTVFGSDGFYWSSSTDSEDEPYDLHFTSSSVKPNRTDKRNIGMSVRLVTEVKAGDNSAPANEPLKSPAPVAPETITPAKQQDGTYQFTMPAANVTVTAEFEAAPPTSQYKYTEYENWQLKHEGSEWQWTENLVKVEEGLFKLPDANWTGSGFNVASDANPIKKDWFAPEELTIGEEVIPPVTVDVYLRVIDDETLKIGVGVDPAPVHAHNPVKVTGQAATETAAGFKDYYECDCGSFFEDENGTTPIENPTDWKAQGGNGYIAPLVHNPELVNGKAPTEFEDGYKPYYECKNCGKYYEDVTGVVEIPDIDAWKSGDGFLPKTLNAVDYDGMPVEPGPETYEVKEDGIHVYGDGIIFSGKSNKPFIIENAFQSLNCKDLVINSDLIIEGLAGGVQLVLNNTAVNGDVVAKKADSEDELYLSVALMGDNTIAGKVDSEGSVTIYGDSDATLSVKNIKTGTMLYAENMRIENMDGEYVFGETTTADPADELAPIVFTVKQYVYFPTADEYKINNGEPFKANEEIEFDLPIVRNENGEVIDPQPELEAAFYVYGEDYSMTLLDGVPTEEGDYCVWFNVSANDPVYCGSSMYDFSIVPEEPTEPEAHEHKLVKQNGKAATKDAAGYKDYYKCDCGKCFEDATGKVEITDLKKWQAEGGSGYIAKLTDSDPDSKIEKTPDTGDSFNAVLWSVVFVLAVAVLGVCIDIDKKKIRVK